MSKGIVARIVVIGLLIAVGGGLAFWKYGDMKAQAQQPPMMPPPETVQFATAREVQWQPTAQLSGTVIAVESVTLSNEVAGTVKDVMFESGAIVEKGQVLLTLDASTEEADLRAAEANVRVAEANMQVTEADARLAEANVRRLTKAMESRATSEAEVDQARSALDGANARLERGHAEVDQARAMVDQIRTTIAKKTLKAPFKARAGLRSVHPGQYLAEGASVVGLQSVTDDIYLDFALPQEQAYRASVGLKVMASAPMLGPDPVEVEVVAIDATADPTTRNVRVRARVRNTGQRLRPGMFVDIVAPYDQPAMYTVIPQTAARRSPFGTHVFVIAPNKDQAGSFKAEQRVVQLGPMTQDGVIVLQGIKPGDVVAADGSFKLRDGAAVQPGAEKGGGEAGGGGAEPAKVESQG